MIGGVITPTANQLGTTPMRNAALNAVSSTVSMMKTGTVIAPTVETHVFGVSAAVTYAMTAVSTLPMLKPIGGAQAVIGFGT
jgi:hypothetical protein